MVFEVTILGSSSATPAYHRHPTAQVVQIHERFFLVDCAEGTLMQFLRYKIRFHRIDHIFISHLHGDHYLGIMGVLSTLHLQGRTAPLHVYGTADLRRIIDLQLELSDSRLRYELVFHEIDPSKKKVILEDELLRVTTLPMNHRIPCCGFLFEEQPRARNLIKAAIAPHRLTSTEFDLLKSGKDVVLPDGTLLRNEEVTVDPPPPRRYAFSSDTLYTESLASHVEGVDLLYHEATFLDDMSARAAETYHSTARQAASLARAAGVGRLLIGHFSARYRELAPFLEEARAIFPETLLAREGDKISITSADQEVREPIRP